ncbi:MAG: phosphate acetyltransferase, partial [Bacteroidales bacterium]|nr:phosphate acetyltransferase [Bacteroidales bacterium]
MELLEQIKMNAKRHNKKIVLPEGTEERTLKAADAVLAEDIARITLLGNPGEIMALADSFGLKNIGKAEIIDPVDHPKKKQYIDLMVELRKNKGLNVEEASKLIEDPLYLGVMMIKSGDADGEVAGARNTTGDVLRPAFQIVKTAPGISVVSGAFIMILKDKEFGADGIIVFADGAVHPDPTDRELAEIAVATARTTKTIVGIDPKVALLSFSTMGSAKHPLVDKVVSATKMAREMAPEFMFEGELQADAALIEAIGQKKAPGSKIAGRANVLVFPNL